MLRPQISSLLLLSIALAGCPVEEPDDKDTADTQDTEVVDTEVVDTEVVDTDPTDETDAGAEVATIRDIRLNLKAWSEGDLLTIEGAVVTSVLGTGTDRGFTVQAATGTTYAGLWVAVASSSTLPTVGQVLTVTGTYRENDEGNPGGTPPGGTRTELVVLDSNPDASWTVTGSGSLPTPVTLTVTGFAGSSELYESMYVSIADTPALFVVNGPGALGLFDVRNTSTGSSAGVTIGSLFTRLDQEIPSLATGDTFTSISGTVHWRDNLYTVEPAGVADAIGHNVYVIDTDSTDVDTDTTDIDTDNTDVDTDNTDDTDFDTDDSDTFTPAETDSDSDQETDEPDPFVTTTVPDIRSGIFANGRYVKLESMVVTAVRFRTVPPASNAFVIQDPNAAATENAGIYVWVSNTAQANLPAIGDLVDVIGEFEEFPTTATPPNSTLARIKVAPTDPLASYTILSSGHALPAPIPVRLLDFQSSVTIEKYESMLVTLSESTPINVVSNVLGTGDFRVSASGSAFQVFVEAEMYDMVNDFAVTNGDHMTSITGVVHHEVTPYKLAPTKMSDVNNFVDN